VHFAPLPDGWRFADLLACPAHPAVIAAAEGLADWVIGPDGACDAPPV
jgi:hypothetical protein